MTAPEASSSHIVLIPSYNTGPILLQTLAEIRRTWSPVWLVIDGSTDASADAAERLAADDPGLTVLRLPRNQGKGAAVLHGIRQAAAAGYTHALTMDADGQHPADHIAAFMARSAADPGALILGTPVFDSQAPALRVRGRRVSNGFVHVETAGRAIADSLFGFRVYPIADLRAVMEGRRWMRRFDFDPEAAVRLNWRGLRCINLPAPVRYLKREDGGVSHFHYGRDNLLLAGMHTRLLLGALLRLPRLLGRSLAHRHGQRHRS